MSNEQKHTPTPWELHDKAISGGSTHIAYIDTASHNAGLGEGEGEANAALIVRAVNCHATLVEALQGVVYCLAWHVENGRGVAMDAKFLADARAALKMVQQ